MLAFFPCGKQHRRVVCRGVGQVSIATVLFQGYRFEPCASFNVLLHRLVCGLTWRSTGRAGSSLLRGERLRGAPVTLIVRRPIVPIYKYLPHRHADAFVSRGEVLFRSLAYFHDLENTDGRADAYEGTREYRPDGGLEITNLTTQQQFNLPESVSLESTAQTTDIFVLCTSMQFSAALAQEFQADICIEIVDETMFIARLRTALTRRTRVRAPKTLLHGPVKYYDSSEAPIVDWALPDRIAMSKSAHFRHQFEYRFAFSVNDAFRVQNTAQVLTNRKRHVVVRALSYPQDLLVLGKLHNLVRVHRFNIAAA